ncbi:MAG: plasmid mobilization relaxosome protein MobC [Candidatus Competibacteraceae bacterium]
MLRHLAEGMTASAYIHSVRIWVKAARRKQRFPCAGSRSERTGERGTTRASRIANNLNQLAYQANTGTLHSMKPLSRIDLRM